MGPKEWAVWCLRRRGNTLRDFDSKNYDNQVLREEEERLGEDVAE